MATTGGPRYDYLDIARAFGIIAVVWVHVAVRIGSDVESLIQPVTLVIKQITYLPMLFLVSGILARTTIGRFGNFFIFFIKIFRSLLVPFYALCLIFFILNFFGSYFMGGMQEVSVMLISVVTFKMDDGLPSGVLWFLMALFEMFVFMYFLDKKVQLSFINIFIIALLLKFFYFFYEFNPYFAISNVSYNFIYFVFGYYVSTFLDFFHGNRKFFLVYLMLFIFSILLSMVHDKYVTIFSSSLGPLAVLMLVSLVEKRSSFLYRFFLYIGQNSLSIFVFHMPFFVFIKILIHKVGLYNSVFGFFVWMSFGVLMPLVLYEILATFPSVYSWIFARNPGMRIKYVLSASR